MQPTWHVWAAAVILGLCLAASHAYGGFWGLLSALSAVVYTLVIVVLLSAWARKARGPINA